MIVVTITTTTTSLILKGEEEEEEEEVITLHLSEQSQQTNMMLSVFGVTNRANFAENEEVFLLTACNVKKETQNNLWYLDTGCSNHMSGDKSAFSVLYESMHDNVKFGDDSKVSVMEKGEVTIQMKSNVVHTISNVLFVPDLKTNLLSIGQLQEKEI
ncbi:Retrovirus-related Pol polyprotein from transposon TNT 1-94 [Gossypium australe]|uniref:Retrovirus-related Pol polyprotein from transposon TNT 1-94 n=1 Tax=Gossypium australe TaxID=47621 RepID=A0A5B6VVW3_9ROSI|nr:Retrovirus-related Pol polyprotein from transposon TNT 1-94 [Gossypium australe]